MPSNLSAEEYYYKLDIIALSASQILREVFKKRWKKETGSDWKNSEVQGTIFKEGLGENAYNIAKNQQKIKIAYGNLDEWDMTIVALVLKNFGDSELYKVENEAVKTLTGLRNKLSHHPTNKLSQEEYNQKVQVFRKTLKVINVDESEIEKLIEEAGASASEAALKATKELLQKGEVHMRKGDFKVAIKWFDEATTMSILPGVAYEKRAECYLLLASQMKTLQNLTDADQCCEHALLDATQALKINSNSWNVHYLLGNCYGLKMDLTIAIHHYTKALAISPCQTKVRKQLHSCKSIAGILKREDNIDPRNSPYTLKELLKGKPITEIQFRYAGRLIGEFIPGQDYVNEGHHEPNDEIAAWLFAKGAELGNPEGIYNFWRRYETGVGVPQEFEAAFKLYSLTVKISPDTQGVYTTANKNLAVASAQHVMGVYHEYGIGVTQDYAKAAVWYRLAAENGMGSASNNLALMYEKGIGVSKNPKMAEMYYNQAVILKSFNAAENLMNYYIQHLELGRAETMFEIGKMLGNRDLQAVSGKDFKCRVKDSLERRKQLKNGVMEFERKNILDVKGLTFLERHQRKLLWEKENFRLNYKLLKFNIQCVFEEELGEGIYSGSSSVYNSILDDEYSYESKVSNGVLKTERASRKLSNFLLNRSRWTDDEKEYVLTILYEICCLEFHAASFSNKIHNQLKIIVEELLHTKCDERKSELDMKIRLCYVSLHYSLTKCMMPQSLDSFGIALLKQGIKKYPENPHFYKPLAILCCQKRDLKSALYFAGRGLQKFPENFDFFYVKGVFHLVCYILTTSEGNLKPTDEREAAVVAFQTFIINAPTGHRNVAGAHFMLAVLKEPGEAFENLITGQESENDVVPFIQTDFSDIIEILFNSSPSTMSNVKIGILNRKQYLCDPVRQKLIVERRQYSVKLDNFSRFKITYSQLPKLQQTTPKFISHCTPITLKEMNPTVHHIYGNRMIDFTIIDEPTIGKFPFIHLVAEDENGDVTRLHIYNVAQDQTAEDVFGCGCRITILNPYMWIRSFEDSNELRNENPTCIEYLEKVENMCRFCGESNAFFSCAKCRKSTYCTRECQKLDCSMMKHKLICSK